MTIKRKYLFLFILLAVLIPVALTLLPMLVGTAVAERGTCERASVRAESEFSPMLNRIDAYYGANNEEYDSCLDDDLMSIRRLNEPVLAYFTCAKWDEEPEFSVDDDELGRAREQAWRELRDDDDEVCSELQQAVMALKNVAKSSGVSSFGFKGRQYLLVWRRLGLQAESLTGAGLCGLVVDYSRSRETPADVLARGMWRLVVLLALAVAGLMALTAVVLLMLLGKARRDALQKTTFVSNVSHELRTPLTGLLSYAEMLKTGRCRTEEMRQKALGVIIDEGRRLDRMVAELLDFSRLDRGTRRYRMEEFNLSTTVLETADRMMDRFSVHGLGVEVPERLMVSADRDTVWQILENLLGNAAKYAAMDGRVEIGVGARDDGGAWVRVSDRGPGMTPSQMRQAFKPFWRADNSTTRETGGYGIGLAVALGYARGMGGDLTVTARDGGGCVFELVIRGKVKEVGNG